MKRELTLPMPTADSYLRVEIEEDLGGRRAHVLRLLSNPILLDADPARASWR